MSVTDNINLIFQPEKRKVHNLILQGEKTETPILVVKTKEQPKSE